MSRLDETMERVNKRSEAAIGMTDEEAQLADEMGATVGVPASEAQVRAMFLGTALSLDEVEEYVEVIEVNLAMMTLSGLPLGVAFRTMLRHAVLVGLTAQVIEQEGQNAPQ